MQGLAEERRLLTEIAFFTGGHAFGHGRCPVAFEMTTRPTHNIVRARQIDEDNACHCTCTKRFSTEQARVVFGSACREKEAMYWKEICGLKGRSNGALKATSMCTLYIDTQRGCICMFVSRLN